MNKRNFFKSIFVGLVTVPTIGFFKKLKENPKPKEKRKLKAVWTAEIEQDLKCYYNINAGFYLTTMMSNEMQKEIDEELIKQLV